MNTVTQKARGGAIACIWQTVGLKNPTNTQKQSNKYICDPQKQDVVLQMICIWYEDILREPQNFFEISSKTYYLLGVFFLKYFNSDMCKWKQFVFYITHSKYLMGKSSDFQVSLEWLWEEGNLMRVKKGLFHSMEEKSEYRKHRSKKII